MKQLGLCTHFIWWINYSHGQGNSANWINWLSNISGLIDRWSVKYFSFDSWFCQTFQLWLTSANTSVLVDCQTFQHDWQVCQTFSDLICGLSNISASTDKLCVKQFSFDRSTVTHFSFDWQVVCQTWYVVFIDRVTCHLIGGMQCGWHMSFDWQSACHLTATGRWHDTWSVANLHFLIHVCQRKQVINKHFFQ